MLLFFFFSTFRCFMSSMPIVGEHAPQPPRSLPPQLSRIHLLERNHVNLADYRHSTETIVDSSSSSLSFTGGTRGIPRKRRKEREREGLRCLSPKTPKVCLIWIYTPLDDAR